MKSKCTPDTYTITSPIGDLEVVSCDTGLHSISQTCKDDKTFLPDLSATVKLTDGDPDSKPVSQCVRWLQVYFDGDTENVDAASPAVCTAGLDENGSFYDEVRLTLRRKVKFGETISYGQLATLVGRAGASRAVGSAMRRNPLSVLVPCHRVIRASGELGRYGGGTRNSVKKWLLDHEQKMKSA